MYVSYWGDSLYNSYVLPYYLKFTKIHIISAIFHMLLLVLAVLQDISISVQKLLHNVLFSLSLNQNYFFGGNNFEK